MSDKLGFCKLRFSVEEGSKKEKIIKTIIKIENNIKAFFIKPIYYIKKRKLNVVFINNQKFYFYDTLFSWAYKGIASEMQSDNYSLNQIEFKPNDIIIDIGANIGIVSIYLAKKYPFLKIYSYEPLKTNYESFIKNIEINKVDKGIIKIFNSAVTKDSRSIVMKTDDISNSGSFTVDFSKNKVNISDKDIVKSTTLDNIIETVLAENKKDSIKLLKIDCELSEYEILENTKITNLKRIQNLTGEFHEKEGFGNVEKLEFYVKKYIPNVKITKCKLD